MGTIIKNGNIYGGVKSNQFNEHEFKIENNVVSLKEKYLTTVDSAISSSSTNPVQNKVIKAELNEKVGFTDYPTRTTAGVAKVETNQNYAYGLKVDSNGFLQCVGANESEIKTGSND